MPSIVSVVSDAEVEEIATRAEQWTGFIASHSTIQPGSSLAADDAACPVLPCSRIAWGCLTFAHHRLVTATSEDHAVALREAMVATSHALTVLAPGRTERTTYGLRIAWTVFHTTAVDPTLAALAPIRSPIAGAEMERLLRERGFEASPRWHESSSVRTAGAATSAVSSDPETFESALRALWQGHLTDPGDLQVADDAVVAMWERAAQLWRIRRAAPTLRPRSPYTGRARFLLTTGTGPNTVKGSGPLGDW